MGRGKRKDTDQYFPSGSIVFWSRRERINGRYLVPVRCGSCGMEHMINTSGIHIGFTGLCRECGHFARRKVAETLPQTLPNGSVIHWEKEYVQDGIRFVPVECGGPFCNGSIRDVPVYTTYPENFTGQCRRCSHAYDRSGRWAGGRKRSNAGYVLIRLPPDHPLHSMVNCDGYVLEHRFVVAQRIGRPLQNHEIVHHKNGIKDDNRCENLELLHRLDYHPGFRSSSDNPGNTPVITRMKRRLIELLS